MDITYNGLNLNDGVNYWVENLPHEAPAKQEVNLQKLARTNESVLLRKGYGVRTISIVVVFEDSTMDLMDVKVDDFKEVVEAIDKNLDIAYASGTRRYVSTGFVETIERRPRWARVAVRFECYKAFGEDTASTIEEFDAKTTSPYADEIDFGGNAPAQPDITITLDSFTGSGTKFMQIKNVDTGEYVRFTADDWAGSDVIVISSQNGIILRNGAVMQYLGIMPIWIAGVNNWEYSDDFSARSVDIKFDYKKKYL